MTLRVPDGAVSVLRCEMGRFECRNDGPLRYPSLVVDGVHAP